MNTFIGKKIISLLPFLESIFMQKFKCHDCHLVVDENPCPVCGKDPLEKMCSEDHICTCSHEISDGARYCPKCGNPICECGSHDVVQISRVTGYLADVSGFNAGKRQELKDRQRYSIGGIDATRF
jgi:hypothetical protein